ncbi:MAG: Gfo/Idh/MocA family protein [Verrucomicrobiales bacterium]
MTNTPLDARRTTKQIMAEQHHAGLGVIGCGGFGLFAMQQFLQVPGVTLSGITGTHGQAAYAAAKRFGSDVVEDMNDFLARPGTDVVYVATPPFLHHQQVLAALRAGKHVICEKPLAVTRAQADEMMALARKSGLLLVTNLMQRYNPLYDKVARLIEARLLGEVLHGFFENYASDEGLREDHWFWDRNKSGGIFIEHGVHFFDMFEGWLGSGKVESAQAACRGDSTVEDQVNCCVRYGSSTLVNHYHGFTQAGRMDRQELRILFERGSISLQGWIPTVARIHGLADEEDTRKLIDIFSGARLDVTAVYGGKDRECRGRFKALDVYQQFELAYGLGTEKFHVYGDLLRAMFTDQLAWTKNRDHQRKITEDNGYRALLVAIEADKLAHGDGGRFPER